jgi:hypothetical protein
MTWANRYEIMATDLAGNTFGLGQFERFERSWNNNDAGVHLYSFGRSSRSEAE